MYLVNGKISNKEEFNISVEDMLVWRGDGIFEAIRIYDGFPFGIELHLERLESSAKKLDLDVSISNIKDWIVQSSLNLKSGYVRTIISRGKKYRG